MTYSSDDKDDDGSKDETQQGSAEEEDSSEPDNSSVHTDEVPDISTHLPDCWNWKMWLNKKRSHPYYLCRSQIELQHL